ncbi:hypothetical protein PR048_030825 [Dryococelus australis]|uniref:Uncharacterized protein n=1 Tax=Dryococelus australis TaxID=614101 RepID=A0ABQ9GAF2_9NEOP|nr:hypothetical protein PR048_030825 [Dryococelus australis]
MFQGEERKPQRAEGVARCRGIAPRIGNTKMSLAFLALSVPGSRLLRVQNITLSRSQVGRKKNSFAHRNYRMMIHSSVPVCWVPKIRGVAMPGSWLSIRDFSFVTKISELAYRCREISCPEVFARAINCRQSPRAPTVAWHTRCANSRSSSHRSRVISHEVTAWVWIALQMLPLRSSYCCTKPFSRVRERGRAFDESCPVNRCPITRPVRRRKRRCEGVHRRLAGTALNVSSTAKSLETELISQGIVIGEGIGHGLSRKPWEAEIMMTGAGIEPGSSRMRVQYATSLGGPKVRRHRKQTISTEWWDFSQQWTCERGVVIQYAMHLRTGCRSDVALGCVKFQLGISLVKAGLIGQFAVGSSRTSSHVLPFTLYHCDPHETILTTYGKGKSPNAVVLRKPRSACGEHWEMTMAMGASGGQAPCTLHASNMRTRPPLWEEQTVNTCYDVSTFWILMMTHVGTYRYHNDPMSEPEGTRGQPHMSCRFRSTVKTREGKAAALCTEHPATPCLVKMELTHPILVVLDQREAGDGGGEVRQGSWRQISDSDSFGAKEGVGEKKGGCGCSGRQITNPGLLKIFRGLAHPLKAPGTIPEGMRIPGTSRDASGVVPGRGSPPAVNFYIAANQEPRHVISIPRRRVTTPLLLRPLLQRVSYELSSLNINAGYTTTRHVRQSIIRSSTTNELSTDVRSLVVNLSAGRRTDGRTKFGCKSLGWETDGRTGCRRGQVLQAPRPVSRGGVVVSPLTSNLGEPGSIPRRGLSPQPRFFHVGIVLDDAAGRRVFSTISHFPRPCIPAPHNTYLTSASLTLKTSMLRASPDLFLLPPEGRHILHPPALELYSCEIDSTLSSSLSGPFTAHSAFDQYSTGCPLQSEVVPYGFIEAGSAKATIHEGLHAIWLKLAQCRKAKQGCTENYAVDTLHSGGISGRFPTNRGDGRKEIAKYFREQIRECRLINSPLPQIPPSQQGNNVPFAREEQRHASNKPQQKTSFKCIKATTFCDSVQNWSNSISLAVAAIENGREEEISLQGEPLCLLPRYDRATNRIALPHELYGLGSRRKQKTWWTWLLVNGFSRGSLLHPAVAFRRCSIRQYNSATATAKDIFGNHNSSVISMLLMYRLLKALLKI